MLPTLETTMNERARQIVDAPDHVTRSKLCTEAEWRGYLWWMHDREGSPPAGGDAGIEAAKILIARVTRTMDKLTAMTITDDQMTITDDQIRQLEREANAADDRGMATTCARALGETGSSIDEDGENTDPDENEIEDARRRCADAINARAQAER